jgi:hypothetical protein
MTGIENYLNLIISFTLALFIAGVTTAILSNKGTSSDTDDLKDDRTEVGYIGLGPNQNVLGNRYVFNLIFVVSLIIIHFICSSFPYIDGI